MRLKLGFRGRNFSLANEFPVYEPAGNVPHLFLAIPVRIVTWNPRVVADGEDFAVVNPVHSRETYQGFDAAIHTWGVR